jgi:Methyltransferase domain
MWAHDSEQLLVIYASLKRELRGRPLSLSQMPRFFAQSVQCWGRLARQHGWKITLRMASWGIGEFLLRNTAILFPVRYPYARVRFAFGVQPLSHLWGLDRGVPIHRHYLRQFLEEFSSDIRGRCLEFQEDSYTSALGGAKVQRSDILHKDPGNPSATIVADITRPNDLPSNAFDCIICTYVLNVVAELDVAIAELHRILKPGGVLLAAVPQFTMWAVQWGDIWRLSPHALQLLLGKVFRPEDITIRAYGNSLTAACDLRGLVVDEITKAELDYYDPRFGLVACARAVKRGDGRAGISSHMKA